MGLYGFKPQFEPFIKDGSKRHTIRAKRRHPDKPGNILYLYVGLRQRGPIIQKLASGEVIRQKMARKLAEVICTQIQDIKIVGGWETYSGEWFGEVLIDRCRLDADEQERLARADGFQSFGEMMTFWKGRLPFHGDLIHWKPLGLLDLVMRKRRPRK